jgi:hypothetical protein
LHVSGKGPGAHSLPRIAMHPTPIALDLDAHVTPPTEDVGFQIGWDHARHGLVPPVELMSDGVPLGQGWRAGRALFGRRTLASTRATRGWLQLRLAAWKQGLEFETTQVTPHYLAQIEATRCPVTRRPLGGAPDDDASPVVVRLNPEAGWAAGHLATLSRRAADALTPAGARAALRQAARVDAGIDAAPAALVPAEVWRLAVLLSFVAPLPFAEALRVPLRVLPPNRVRLLNAVQGLQALLTVQFAKPGWSERLRAVADLLPLVAPGRELRQDFNIFVGAFAPRLLEAGAGHDAPTMRRVLEDAWCNERVNRRWQSFVLALGESAVEALLERAAADGLAATRTLLHAPALATEGWSLASSGRLPAQPRRAPVLRTPPRPKPGAAVRG